MKVLDRNLSVQTLKLSENVFYLFVYLTVVKDSGVSGEYVSYHTIQYLHYNYQTGSYEQAR